MRAVVIEDYGSPEVLQLQELPNLEPERGEVRVKVRAFAGNCGSASLYGKQQQLWQSCPHRYFRGVIS